MRCKPQRLLVVVHRYYLSLDTSYEPVVFHDVNCCKFKGCQGKPHGNTVSGSGPERNPVQRTVLCFLLRCESTTRQQFLVTVSSP